MKARCSHCGHIFSVPLEYAGETVKCPKCKESVETPDPPNPSLINYILIAIVSAALAGMLGFTCGALLTKTSREKTDMEIASIQSKADKQLKEIRTDLQHAKEEIIKLKKQLRGSEQEKDELARSTQKAWDKARELESKNNNSPLSKSDSNREYSSSSDKDRETLIENQFSVWNGSHHSLTKYIKDSMNDPSSYKHVETKYIDKGDYLIVITTFRGKNAFGGVVKNSITAQVDLDGNIISIISQYP